MRVGGAGCSLVKDGCVGVAVLFDDGHDQHDEFRPEVQVLDAGALLLKGNLLLVLVGVEGKRSEVKLSSAPLPQPTQRAPDSPCLPAGTAGCRARGCC